MMPPLKTLMKQVLTQHRGCYKNSPRGKETVQCPLSVQGRLDAVFLSYVRADAAYLKAYEESEGWNFVDRMLDFLKGYYLKFEESSKGMTKVLVSSYFVVSRNNYYRKDRVLVQCFEKMWSRGRLSKS